MLIIAPMKEADLSAVVAIENTCFSAPKSEAIFREDEHKYLVAKEDGKIIGYIGHEKVLDEIHIINMAVHPDYRSRGIGSRLIDKILNDQDTFFLEVRVTNVPAIRLYEKYGFKNISLRKKYYADNDEDAY